MDHKKYSEFKVVADNMASAIEAFLEAQEAFHTLLCLECDIPLSLKDEMIRDINGETRSK